MGTSARRGTTPATAAADRAVAVVTLLWLGPRSHADHGAIVETFDVPSSRWFGLPGMAAQVRGTLRFDGDCPVLIPEEAGEGILVFPWAVGVTYADGQRAVVQRLTGGVYGVEGQLVDFAEDGTSPFQGATGSQPAKAAPRKRTSTSTPGRDDCR